jgi:RNA recognition motif-containing protein
LKFDTHRRFCYVQFASAAQAVAATQLNGTDVEGLKLNVKISNPQAKKKRDGATAEGREVYVWHLNFKIKKQEVQETFAQFGHIDRINFPTLKNGNNKGFCFVVYDTKESADAAVAEMDKKELWGLELHVEIANDRNETKPKIRSTLENASSPAPREAASGKAEAAPAAAPGAAVADAPAAAFKAAPFNERSLAILNLPDTVPDVRIRPLVEAYGFKKITLEPQHGGAVIEFTSVEGAGKAEIALQGLDFEGRKLRIGTVKDLRQQKGEWKAANSFVQPNRVNRPTAPRGGGRARGRTGFGARPAVPRATATTNGEAKSNNDFRNMILNKTPKEKEGSNDKMEE